MAGDLEDFLKRAAARRQAKAQQQPRMPAQAPQKPVPRPPAQRPAVAKQGSPPYTDRRRERVVIPREDNEPILVAEVVDAPDGMAKRRQAAKDAKTEASRVVSDAAQQLAALRKASGESGTPGLVFTGDTRADLIRLLRQPAGLKQAILLREILDRPVGWD